ncbi:SDR family oxidoreductase [bacterium]|nr:MAG: SDR family oxidoreductase [bacterium]
MNSLFDLSGKTAAVLGGTGELGGAMALALAQAGASVAILGRNAQNGDAKVARIEHEGGKARFFFADALDKAALVQTRNEIESSFGEISILVNAAGGNKPGATLPPGADFCALDLEAWNEVFDLNLAGGALIPSQVFGEKMVERGQGSIINIASMSGMIPLSRVVAYSAAKAAVLNLTMFLAREWAQQGVRVNAISPGFFPAEQNKKLLFNDDGSYSQRGQSIINHTPMARFGVAEELAGAVVFLASQKASSFMTGQNVVLDGGFSSCTI